jgi:hypothetical protein
MAINRSGTQNVISKEAYLALIREANIDNEFYDDPSEEFSDEYSSNSWVPSVSPAKENLLYFRARQKEEERYRPIDALNMKRAEIVELLRDHSQFQVGEFNMNIRIVDVVPEGRKLTDDIRFSISVKQKKTRTPGGFPCNMTYNMNFKKDNRFKSYPWVSLFSTNGWANNVPLSEVVVIIKYLQLTQRLNAFT